MFMASLLFDFSKYLLTVYETDLSPLFWLPASGAYWFNSYRCWERVLLNITASALCFVLIAYPRDSEAFHHWPSNSLYSLRIVLQFKTNILLDNDLSHWHYFHSILFFLSVYVSLFLNPLPTTTTAFGCFMLRQAVFTTRPVQCLS